MSAVRGDTFKNTWIFYMLNYSEVELQSRYFLIHNYLKVKLVTRSILKAVV